MTHFSVLVIGDNPEGQLAPYHQYECTGINDEYVKDVDCTSEFFKEFEFFISVNGVIAFKEYLSKYSDLKEVHNQHEIDIKGLHQWGYFTETEDGNLKVIRRTNPNNKWDYYSAGPDTFFKVKNNKSSHSAKKSDILFNQMMRWPKYHAHKDYDHYQSIVNQVGKPKRLIEIKQSLNISDPFELQKKTREIYKNQDAIKILKKSLRFRDEMSCLVKKFSLDRESYSEYEMLKPFAFDATIINNQWYDRLSGGWNSNMLNLTEYEWLKHTWTLIQTLPNDTLISVYACHS